MSQLLFLCIQKNRRATGGGWGGKPSFCLKICIYMCIQIRVLGLGVSPMGRTSFRRLLWPLAAAPDGWQVCAGRHAHFRNHACLWHGKVFSIPLQKSAAIPLSAQEQMKSLKSVSWHPLGLDPPAAVPCAWGGAGEAESG